MCFWFLTHTCSLQILSTVTDSTLRLWGALCYPQIWSLWWCRDGIMMISWWWKIKLFTKNTFLRKVTVVFFQNSHFWRMFAGYLYIHLRECLILASYIKLGCELLTLYSLLGCEHVLKGEKDKNLEPSRRESSRRVSWLSNGYSVLAFQISWDHSLSK